MTDAPPDDLTRMTFLEHLEELRKRLLWSVIAVAAGFFLSWWKAQDLFRIAQKPILEVLPAGTKLAYTNLTEPFMLYLNIALIAGIFLASPVILYQVWLFVAPGLYRHEKRWVVPFVFFAALSFCGGGWFGYAVAFPMVAQFLVTMGADFTPVLKIDDYLSILSKILLGMGLVFQTPIVIVFFVRIGVVTEKWLLQKFRYAVLVIFLIAALITPTPDIPTQCAFALPMIALYLLGIFLAWIVGKRKKTEPAV
ncbi:MAG TPA: twin-arginine translocase subunit TatC [Thermoanaerobaculia bacterium]|nr:twin-arginine translocase subunit TatC [Thermoanaerobaculia bacterium]HPA52243.1 twin-arginine translocase subunit TatC [Thermoanaerobaculia bacterium]HQN08281.1 twin-arginine translocase subunit TatC [Thermoanaerobaculia bacterium]HQP87003.1 twin-arginine translocase subunit TatC [Thermoanaerobaculia bacterium]